MSITYKWVGNVLVAPDKSLFTVFDDGTLEIRGIGWDRRRKKREHSETDRPRICKLDSKEQAMAVAELIVEQLYGSSE